MMDDLISRQAAIDAVNTALFPKINTAKDAEKALREVPSVQSEIAKEISKDAADVMESLVRIARALAEVLESGERKDDA